MRYDNIFRFLGVAFVAGAVAGLLSGLTFGGPDTTAAEDTAPPPVQASVAEAKPVTAEQAAIIGANELGLIPVLEYHKIGETESDWTRTPENFRADLQKLKETGYYPVNLRDLARASLDVPAGKTPVVLTFDDSSPGQFRLKEDGTLDPECAVAIMNEAAEAGDWDRRATFFVLLDVQPEDNVLFGQPDQAEAKIARLVEWGYEVGSHTVTHLNLRKASAQEARKQLAVSKIEIERLAGEGYEVYSLSVPFGEYPEDDALFSGEYEGTAYSYSAAVEVTGGPAPSPFSLDFDPLHIPRTIVRGDALDDLLDYFRQNPELRYISDGDPAAVSAPQDLPEELGTPPADLGRPLIRY